MSCRAVSSHQVGLKEKEENARRVQVEYRIATTLFLTNSLPKRLDAADLVLSDLDPVLTPTLNALFDPYPPHSLDDSTRLPHRQAHP
mgnify:CR=1 FL=1